jgi:23S rRNA (cytidine1920-2'-O)/16S rRNA (cytidine1409-2'-O)-methyltransferase
MVDPDTPVALMKQPRRFVSRGGDKLDGALDRLGIDVRGQSWLDAGASTGGFTDCLLQRGAAKIAAVDVGYGQLDWGLRNDDRVEVLERVNVRTLVPDDLPWVPDGVVADLSFISLRLVLPALVEVAGDDASFVVLVKPQFEVGKEQVGSGGVVRDPELWAAALGAIAAAARGLGLGMRGATVAEPPGPAGNREFFLHLRAGDDRAGDHIRAAIAAAGGG